MAAEKKAKATRADADTAPVPVDSKEQRLPGYREQSGARQGPQPPVDGAKDARHPSSSRRTGRSRMCLPRTKSSGKHRPLHVASTPCWRRHLSTPARAHLPSPKNRPQVKDTLLTASTP
ncbi:hypothetical protein DFH09DRAFT_1329709 [Mycena vulgaris]|nr:hypothetical protein DFH09DRAFT_1329709 [Mycena vulgaris]